MTTDAEVETFLRRFEACTLPRSEWTHAMHLVMALWYLRLFPRPEATRRIREGIQRYNRSQGNDRGYHETVTLAWVAIVGRFLHTRDRSRPVSDLARELLEECGARDYLSRFYSKDLLRSDMARSRWVPPDREPIEAPTAIGDGPPPSSPGPSGSMAAGEPLGGGAAPTHPIGTC